MKKCSICGKKLSRYNPNNECFCHSIVDQLFPPPQEKSSQLACVISDDVEELLEMVYNSKDLKHAYTFPNHLIIKVRNNEL